MIIRSKTPLRLGLAGGGTDVSPFCDLYGGCVLNVTINLFAYCTLIPTDNQKIVLESSDTKQFFEGDSSLYLDLSDRNCLLAKGVYNALVKRFNIQKPLSFKMITYTDAPVGSGLGTSSTLVVTIIKAFQEWLKFSLSPYELAQLAFDVERKDLGFAGGKQDQYAAAFGGMNFLEFFDNERVTVTPLSPSKEIWNEMENSLVLFFVGVSRDSSKIIQEQMKATKNEKALSAMHELKKQTSFMKECILKGDFDGIAECLERNWIAKKQTASVIANPLIEEIHDFALAHGAKACKISGAGGGGFMMMWCPPGKRAKLIQALQKYPQGIIHTLSFTTEGAKSWTVEGLQEELA